MPITEDNLWDRVALKLGAEDMEWACKGRNGYFKAHEAVVWRRGPSRWVQTAAVELDIRGVRGVSNIIAFFSPDEAEQVARLMLEAVAVARQEEDSRP